jgi:hypothetical protein
MNPTPRVRTQGFFGVGYFDVLSHVPVLKKGASQGAG